MAPRLTINIERVRDHRSLLFDGRHLFGLPCHEVDGFGDFRHDPTYVTPCRLRDWPTLWAVALIEGDDDYTLSFHFHAGLESREDALAEARRLARSLLNDQDTRRQSLRRYGSLTSLDARVEFEDRLRRERVFFGPLSEAGFTPFARGKGSAATRDGLLHLQERLATKLLCLVSRGLRALPAEARRCVCSFAFTPRACSALLQAPREPGSLWVSFRVLYPAGQIPIHYEWVESVPCDATLNDVCRLIQAMLWECSNNSFIGGQRYADDALRAIVLLLAIPFYRRDYRPGVMPPYFYQAHRFQRFAARLPRRNGLLHVEAFAVDKEMVISNT